MVNVNKIGSYKVYYNAKDQAGNKAVQVVRTVNVIEPSPTPTPTPTLSPTPTVEPTPTDRVEFERRADGTILANVIFEKTIPPKQEDIVLYIAYYEDNRLMHVETPKLTKLSALFEVYEPLADCEIKAFVWDKNMKPLMKPQKLNNIK